MNENESYHGQARCAYCGMLTSQNFDFFKGGYIKTCSVCKKPFLMLNYDNNVKNIFMHDFDVKTRKCLVDLILKMLYS